MNQQDWLEAFAAMSARDREAVRTKILRGAGLAGTPGVGCAMATTIELMERIKCGEDPIEACRELLDEMAGMCTD